MNKSIEIKHFSLIDYNILLKVVAEYVKQYQISRNKFEYEKDMFDLTDTLYALQCHKNAVNIEIENQDQRQKNGTITKKVIAENLLTEMEATRCTIKKVGGKDMTGRSFSAILASGLNNYC